ncbi:hypothetical protein ACIQVC_10595 [Streptomyces sp. NPDC101112]|jgi:hypothetical protein|uniref:hypothetical protein n=1 Tax=Streptomyces sp. NPDC101112 TaxID=3366105 RepID=UPI00382C9511
MRKSLVATLAGSVVALLLAGPGPTASAASSYCEDTTPNSSILFYKRSTGEAATGTLSDGRWQYKTAFDLPTGYTHAAASRDSIVLYNTDTGAGEAGTFESGRYEQVQSFDDFSRGWTHVEAAGDTVLFYNSRTGQGVTGTLTGGEYQHGQFYSTFSKGWSSIAASCDTAAFAAGNRLGFGTLQDGLYTHQGARNGAPLGTLTATEDSLLALARTGSRLQARVATATDGSVGTVRGIGTTGLWDKVGRTSDSLFFYKTNGTAWTSTLTDGNYANVGSLANVSSGWTLIEGGV